MKLIGKIPLSETVEASFLSIGEGAFESIHLVIADTKTEKIIHLENFFGLKMVLSNMNTETARTPITPEDIKAEVNDVFVFNAPMSSQTLASCERIQNACRELALAIAEEVPEGKEQTIAINNLLATAIWARQGVTRRQVAVMAAMPLPEDQPGELPPPVASTSPASPS